MAYIFTNLTSIHGRRIAVSATGAIVDREGYAAGMIDASGVRVTAAKSFSEMVSSSGSVLQSSGVSVLSSGTATSVNLNLYAPSSGQDKEVFSLASATTVILETSATGIYFTSTAGDSTRLTFSGSGGTKGECVILRGLTASRWLVLQKTGGVT